MTNHPPQRPPEIVLTGGGGWISGPSAGGPQGAGTPPRRNLPALLRLIQHTGRWLIAWHGDGYWSAEHADGTQVRYVAGHSLDELADAIDRAEARP